MKVAVPEETVLARQREERAEIARIVAGEIDRFEYFVKAYQKRIYRLAYTCSATRPRPTGSRRRSS